MKSGKYRFIKGENVNPHWVIENYYMVSEDGVILNTKTGNLIYPNKETGKVSLNVQFYGVRANFNIKNIIAATFNNEYTYRKHIK